FDACEGCSDNGTCVFPDGCVCVPGFTGDTCSDVDPSINIDAGLHAAICAALDETNESDCTLYESDLASLTSLTIDSSFLPISDLSGLEYCESLEELSIDDVDLTAVSNIDTIGSLDTLTSLTLSNCSLDDIALQETGIIGLDNLNSLDLSDNAVSDLTIIATHLFDNLTDLNIDGNIISGIPDDFFGDITVVGASSQLENVCDDACLVSENQVCDSSTSTCVCSSAAYESDGACIVSDACNCIHGICATNVGECICTDGWAGRHCMAECSSATDCNGNGLCVNNEEEAVCSCLSGWDGDDCSESLCLSDGNGNICGENGTCSRYGICQCESNAYLSTVTGLCITNSDCEGCGSDNSYGTCTSNGCVCDYGYGGQLCTELTCKSSQDDLELCNDQGYCVLQGNSYLCMCINGSDGILCENARTWITQGVLGILIGLSVCLVAGTGLVIFLVLKKYCSPLGKSSNSSNLDADHSINDASIYPSFGIDSPPLSPAESMKSSVLQSSGTSLVSVKDTDTSEIIRHDDSSNSVASPAKLSSGTASKKEKVTLRRRVKKPKDSSKKSSKTKKDGGKHSKKDKGKHHSHKGKRGSKQEKSSSSSGTIKKKKKTRLKTKVDPLKEEGK
ncbi:hypothetical protein ADUPG1_012871, partial [Aduncisulcus paluster]